MRIASERINQLRQRGDDHPVSQPEPEQRAADDGHAGDAERR